MEGWIKLHRSLTEWEWYQDGNTVRLFVHLLLKANTKDRLWQGENITRGQLISSLSKLSEETGLSIAQVRTCINKMKRTGEITHQNRIKYGLFTIVNYDRYQCNDTHNSNQMTSLQHAGDNPVATTKEGKNKKKDKNIYTPQFEEFWSAYPRKVDKGRCFSCYKSRIKDGFSAVQLLKAAKKYADQCKKNDTEEQYVKHGATFLSASKPFLDYLPQIAEPVSRKENLPEPTIQVGLDWNEL